MPVLIILNATHACENHLYRFENFKSYLEYKKKFMESTNKLNKILDNFKIVTPPTETTVSGINACTL